ncbi:vancomycin resistance protein VanJ [Saccharopolyspora shandongensis]|uniref:Vancomycin resistance protein VanJ n=1 Tax=Saccharopolyspora shandongensis TaxID=418495 RepID=A0A1H2R834_9PSEU|nr:endonuclease/exonuclease/phosphatase family protein [Saccharopolyspora shandongensis]SDW15290.1 vancomycin resistance protein VanJ [Saccharopolyspora shandongensis]
MRVMILICCGALALLLGCHTLVPDVGGAGTLLDSAAPWLGVLIPVLALVGLAGRTRATAAVLVPAVVWCATFGVDLIPRASAAGGDFRVASQNMFADNENPSSTVADLAATDADLIGVQELTGQSRAAAREILSDDYPHHTTIGTVGLWSRFPIEATEPVDLGLGWTRALRALVRTPHGPVTVFVAHLPSLRPDSVAARNRSLTSLAAELAADRASRVIVLADLNTATTDREMEVFPPNFHVAQDEAGTGAGFTWPAGFPLVRIDHVLYSGVRATDAGVVSTRGSDHRAVVVDFAFG